MVLFSLQSSCSEAWWSENAVFVILHCTVCIILFSHQSLRCVECCGLVRYNATNFCSPHFHLIAQSHLYSLFMYYENDIILSLSRGFIPLQGFYPSPETCRMLRVVYKTSCNTNACVVVVEFDLFWRWPVGFGVIKGRKPIPVFINDGLVSHHWV